MKKNGRCQAIMHQFRDIDSYSEQISFNFDGGKSRYKTYIGAVMTLLLTISVMSYGIKKLDNMFNHVNSNISEEVLVDFFNITQ